MQITQDISQFLVESNIQLVRLKNGETLISFVLDGSNEDNILLVYPAIVIFAMTEHGQRLFINEWIESVMSDDIGFEVCFDDIMTFGSVTAKMTQVYMHHYNLVLDKRELLKMSSANNGSPEKIYQVEDLKDKLSNTIVSLNDTKWTN
jgi:hypothetical protein